MRMDQVIAAAIQFGRGAGGDAVVAWKGQEAYVLSYDRTVLLHVKGIVPSQQEAVAFRACDYEGPLISPDGPAHIKFKIKGGWARVPSPAGFSFDGLAALFDRLRPDAVSALAAKLVPAVLLDKSILSMIDDSLPHVELFWDDDGCHLVQRDIYTGKTVELMLMPVNKDVIQQASPLAIRTADFVALFGLAKSLLFISASPVFLVLDNRNVTALVGGCLYDDIGKLRVAGGKSGRQEQEGD